MEGPPNTNGQPEKTAAEYAAMGYYERLGVPRDASQDDIKDAFRALSQQFHPDVPGGGNPAIMKELSEAYASLKKEETRRDYDRNHPAPKAASSGDPFEDIFTRMSREAKQRTAERKGASESRSKTESKGATEAKKATESKGPSSGKGPKSYQYEKAAKAYGANKPPEEVRQNIQKEAIKRVPDGAFLFKLFTSDLERKGISTAEDILSSSEVQSAIILAALKEIKASLFTYGTYVYSWETQFGFDRKKIDQDPRIQSFIIDKAVEEAKGSAFTFGIFARSCQEYGLTTAALLAKNEKVLDVARKQVASAKAQGDFMYRIAVDSWKQAGVRV